MASPWGPHDSDVQAVLHRMRAAPIAGKLVLVCKQPYRQWALARLPPGRGGVLEYLDLPAFTSLADAERAAFRVRWQEMTGATLPDL